MRQLKQDPTCIGSVRHVLGATVTVALNADLAGVAPIYYGRLQPIGQIGSIVRIPQGLVDLVATVSLVGIAELSKPLAPVENVQADDRWLQVQLLGEINRTTGEFKRGVGTYPGLDDPVHFATPDQLRSVFPRPDENHVRFGSLAAADEVPLCLHAGKFVVRHSAIVGSTGSGKTTAVAKLLQNFVDGGWGAANIVVIDPHSEYANALKDHAEIRSVLRTGDKRVRVPYWALSAAEIYRIFAGVPAGHTLQTRFSELVVDERRTFVEKCEWLNLDPAIVTSDTPVPFNLRNIWYKLDYENRETRNNKSDPETVCLVEEGNAQELIPARFSAYNPSAQAPHKGPTHGNYGTGPDLLRLGLVDPRLKFFQEPQGTLDGHDPLEDSLREWLGHTAPISVLDFGGVPTMAADLAIGVILNLIFEVAIRSESDGAGVGRPNPVLIVLEEAHRYLGESASALTQDAANRIAREGRKYGVGLLMVSQRPAELPQTALAQCGTIIALRLSNSEDQNTVRAALPDSIAGLAAVLPALRTHEAIIAGEAVVLPARGCIDLPDPWPKAEDPPLKRWRESAQQLEFADSLAQWRGTYRGEDA